MEKTYKQFKDLAEKESLPVLVECWASWCLPCKQYDGILKEFAREFDGRCVIVKVNVDKNPKMSTEYQVQGLPTFLLVHRNEVTQRKVGSQPVDALRDMIERAVGVREHDDDGAKQTHAVSEEDEDRIIEDQLKDLGYL